MPGILIIDDEEDVRDALQMILEGAGHTVRTATNGKEGLELQRMEPADLVITLGTTGNYAGRMRGHSIRADGSVVRWEGKYVEENTDVVGRLRLEQVDSLWMQIQEIGFFEHDQQETGNSTAFVNVTAEGKSHRVAWALTPGEPPPEMPIPQFYASCRALVEQSSGQ